MHTTCLPHPSAVYLLMRKQCWREKWNNQAGAMMPGSYMQDQSPSLWAHKTWNCWSRCCHSNPTNRYHGLPEVLPLLGSQHLGPVPGGYPLGRTVQVGQPCQEYPPLPLALGSHNSVTWTVVCRKFNDCAWGGGGGMYIGKPACKFLWYKDVLSHTIYK